MVAYSWLTLVSSPVPMLSTSPLPPVTALMKASTTSSTYTKSRVWVPSPKMVQAWPPSRRPAKMATTPASPWGSWRGPYTLARARAQ